MADISLEGARALALARARAHSTGETGSPPTVTATSVQDSYDPALAAYEKWVREHATPPPHVEEHKPIVTLKDLFDPGSRKA